MSQLLYSYGKKSYTDAELAAVNRVYDATLRDLDDTTGDLLDDLAARGVLDNTIVVFTLGPRRAARRSTSCSGHRNAVYQALLHVPLVIAYPKKLQPARVDTPGDPTSICTTRSSSWPGSPLPDGDYKRGNLANVGELVIQALFSESISFGPRRASRRSRARFADLTRDVYANKVPGGHQGRLQADSRPSTSTPRSSSSPSCTTLAVDPHEEQDLADSDPDRVAELAEDMAAWRKGIRKHAGGPVEGEAPMSKAECENLKMLGYIVGDCDEIAAGGAADGADPDPSLDL